MEGSAQGQLTVKLQYKEYEEGEFSDIRSLTAEETIQLIAGYPWAEQRDHISIGLTNPSVTIEGPDNNYLKLSPYYNNKFALHYFDKDHHLYTQSFDQLAKAFPVIRLFFETRPFDLEGFKKENTWLQTNTRHFATNDFHYTLKPARLALPSFTILYLLFAAGLGTFGLSQIWIGLGLIWLAGFLILIGSIVALMISHCRAAKDNVLIISRGKDEFSYGPFGSPERFTKKNIREIRTYGTKSKGEYQNLTVVEIVFTNDRSIEISCLMIPQLELARKIPHSPQAEFRTFFPFIARDAAIPSV